MYAGDLNSWSPVIGNNKNFLQKCQVLQEYMVFVDKVRDQIATGKELEIAIGTTIEECLQEHILEDFLQARRDEVMKVMTLDYTWERREELIREEEREEGRAEGRANVLVAQIKRKLEKNKTIEQIADELESTPEEIKRGLWAKEKKQQNRPQEAIKLRLRAKRIIMQKAINCGRKELLYY